MRKSTTQSKEKKSHRISETVKISGTILKRTNLAIKIATIGTKGNMIQVWFPLSQTTQIHEASKDTVGEDFIYVYYWIAESRGLV